MVLENVPPTIVTGNVNKMKCNRSGGHISCSRTKPLTHQVPEPEGLVPSEVSKAHSTFWNGISLELKNK